MSARGVQLLTYVDDTSSQVRETNQELYKNVQNLISQLGMLDNSFQQTNCESFKTIKSNKIKQINKTQQIVLTTKPTRQHSTICYRCEHEVRSAF